MTRIESSQSVTAVLQTGTAGSAQRLELHAKSSISGTESKGCLATIWQGIKNVFNFLFGWIFRCCGCCKEEKTFQATPEFQAFYDDFIHVYYPHLDIDYFEDFDKRKDLYMRALRGDFYPVEESKIRALAQWLKDEQKLFVTSEEEKEGLAKQLGKLCERFLKKPQLADQSDEKLLEMLLEDPLSEKILFGESIQTQCANLTELTKDKPHMLSGVHASGFTSDSFDLFAHWVSSREGTFFTRYDLLNEIADAIEEGNVQILKHYNFSDDEAKSKCLEDLRAGNDKDENKLIEACFILKNCGYKLIENKQEGWITDAKDSELIIPLLRCSRKNGDSAFALLSFDTDEGFNQFKKVKAEELNAKEKK